MKYKLFATTTIALLCISGLAQAQVWEREDVDGMSYATGYGSGRTTLHFHCGAYQNPEIARFSVTVPWRAAWNSKLQRGDEKIDAQLSVDGVSHPVRMEWGSMESLGVEFYVTAQAAVADDLTMLVAELQNGSTATFSVPALGFTTTVPLTGSREALYGIYRGCGMLPTGTNSMFDPSEIDPDDGV